MGRIIEGVYYGTDGAPAHRGAVRVDGKIYYAGKNGVLVKNQKKTIHHGMANGLLKHGTYYFDGDGVVDLSSFSGNVDDSDKKDDKTKRKHKRHRRMRLKRETLIMLILSCLLAIAVFLISISIGTGNRERKKIKYAAENSSVSVLSYEEQGSKLADSMAF